VIELRGACERYRPALIDFVDRGDIAPGTAKALAHLDRCSRCTEDLESTLLAITALRRIGDDLARVEPSADAWPRLRARLETLRPKRWAIMTPSAGLVMSVALVAVLVAPLRLGGATNITAAPSHPTAAQIEAASRERRVEAAYIASVRQGTFPQSAPAGPRSPATFPARYPDNIHPDRKEVSPAEPMGRPSEAI
jgi:hypothetical protein